MRSGHPLPRVGVRDGQPPRWDSAYANVTAGPMPAYQRSDNRIIDHRQRPSADEYERHLWLVEEMKSVRYADDRLPQAMSFAVQDGFFTAVFAVACEVLADIGDELGRPAVDVRDLSSWADRFRAGLLGMTDQRTGAARDFDVRAGSWIITDTAAQFAPLLCGGLPDARSGPYWHCSTDRLLRPSRPEVRPASVNLAAIEGLSAPEYWRGPGGRC